MQIYAERQDHHMKPDHLRFQLKLQADFLQAAAALSLHMKAKFLTVYQALLLVHCRTAEVLLFLHDFQYLLPLREL